MTASKMNPANAKNTKGVAKKAIAKAPVEAAAEAKLSVENSASTGPLGSAFTAQVVSDSDGGQSGGSMGSTALILGGLALAGGIAVAAAGGGTDTTTVPVPTPTPPQPLPSYSVAASATSVDEGKSITFTITDANKVAGQKVTWSVNPDRAADIDGPTSGEVTIDQTGKATVTIVVKADATTETAAETLTFTVGSQSASATINDTSKTPPPAAQAFTLTTGVDAGTAFVGGDAGDTYNANTSTLSVGDDLNGGAGTDTLVLSSNLTDPVSLGSFTTTSVENLNVNIQDGDTATAEVLTLNMLNAPVSKVSLSGLSTTLLADGLTLNNLAAGASLQLTSATNLKLNANYVAAATAGTADAVSLALADVGSTAGGDTVVTIGAGFETLNVSTSGAAAVVGDINFGGTKIVVTGDKDLTVTEALETSVADVNASAFTGKLSVVTGAIAEKTNPSTVDVVDLTVTGGSGNDTINVSSADTTREILVDAGAGDDTVTIGAALVNASATTAGDVVKGGTGADTLVAGSALVHNIATADAWTGLSGFETLSVANATADLVINAANLSADIKTVKLTTGATAGAGATVNFAAGDGNTVSVAVSAGIAAGNTLTVTSAGSGTADAVTIANGNAATGTNQFASTTSALVATGVETLTINTGSYTTATSQNVSTVSVTASTGGTAALVITGSNGLTTAGAITAATINASASGALVMGAAAASGLTSITGSAYADTLVGDSSSTISGGAGNDTITGGSGNDVLNGDDGDDSITTGAGTDTVTGGAGNDTIIVAGDLSSLDKIDGGDGTADTLSATNASLTALKAQTITEANAFNDNFNNVERLTLTDALNQTSFDLGYLGGVNYVTLENGITDAETLAGFTSGSTINLRAADTDTLTATVNNASTGTADAMTLILSASANADYGDFSLANVETLTINVTEVTASTNIRAAAIGVSLSQATGGAAQTVNITGTESLTIDTAVAAGTIDASGMTVAASTDNGLTLSTFATIAQTITGSGKVDTLVGSTKGDTINAGAGNDTIYGGTGADTIDGGSGTDTYNTNGMVGDAIEGTGTGTSTGVVINLGSTAISAATIHAATNAQYISAGLTSVAAGTASYLFGGESSLNTTVSDTITNVENVTLGGNGKNYVVGSDAANVIVGGSGDDYIKGGEGNDTITGGAGADQIVLTETTAAADTVIYTATADFGDTITGFAADTGADVVSFAAALLANGTKTTTLASVANTGAIGANDVLIEITTATAAGGADTAAEIEAFLTNLNFTEVANGDKVVFAVNDGTDTYLWYYAENGVTAEAQAVELSLVAKLSGVTNIATGDLTFA